MDLQDKFLQKDKIYYFKFKVFELSLYLFQSAFTIYSQKTIHIVKVIRYK